MARSEATYTWRVFYLTRAGNPREAVVVAHNADEAIAIVCGVNIARYGRTCYRVPVKES